MADEIMQELWAIKDEMARNANYDVRTVPPVAGGAGEVGRRDG